jgi:hypothetical protein
MATKAEDEEAKKFEVPPDKSRIYVFRNEIYASAYGIPTSLDSTLKGRAVSYSYFAWDVEPGRHLISCLEREDRTIEIFAKVGKAVFVKEEFRIGAPHILIADKDCELSETSEKVGMSGVKSCKLIKPIEIEH